IGSFSSDHTQSLAPNHAGVYKKSKDKRVRIYQNMNIFVTECLAQWCSVLAAVCTLDQFAVYYGLLTISAATILCGSRVLRVLFVCKFTSKCGWMSVPSVSTNWVLSASVVHSFCKLCEFRWLDIW
ncbi:hypothetical protein Tco_0900222, partial [Tanacetum coccineum]